MRAFKYKMSKIDKEFVLSDSSVTQSGFRLLTAGYQINEFAKNPIGYFMSDRAGGVVVKWEDLKIVNDKVIGKPVINMSNARGQRTFDEIQCGFLNAAAVGHIIIIETSEDPSLKLPGQTGPTITKWFNRECSLVDIPDNYATLCLYDTKEKPIALNHFFKSNTLPAMLDKEQTDNLNIDELLSASIKNNDITPQQAVELKRLYQNDATKLKMALNDFSKERIKYLMDLGWEQLDKKGLLEELKRKYLQGFNQVFFDRFGKAPEQPKSSEDKQTEIDVDALLKLYIDNNTINAQVAQGLRRNFTDPEKLKSVLEEFAKQRIEWFMGMDYDKLDRKGLLEELKEKYFQGFKQKFKDKYHVDYTGK